MAYHYRAAAIILALGLTVGVPAAAAAQQSATPGSPATASPCSEVCSGGGYGSETGTTNSNYRLPTTVNYAGNPAPCSEVCSGGGSGSETGTTNSNYRLPTTVNYAGNPVPCSEVCSGRGYDFASQPSLDAG